MPRSRPTSTPHRRARTVGRIGVAAGLALALAMGAACTAASDVEVGAGDGGSVGGTAAPAYTAPPTVPAPGQVAPAPPGSIAVAPPTTCVDGPATTTPFDQGGGRITCSTVPPDQAVASPPNTDTTVPPPTTSLGVDNTHGVLLVSATGGLDCGGEACPDIGVIMQGQIVVEGEGITASTDIDPTGRAGFRLEPGTYRIRAAVTQGSCDETSVTLGLRVQDVPLRCSVPR